MSVTVTPGAASHVAQASHWALDQLRSAAMLPFDVICSIIDIAGNASSKDDRKILLPLSVLDHDSAQYANRYIWREISLVPRRVTAQDLRARCHAIMRQAPYIRRLDVVFRHEVAFAEGGIDEVEQSAKAVDYLARSKADLFKVIANAIFACARDLEELSILGPYHLNDIGVALSHATRTLCVPVPENHVSPVAASSSPAPSATKHIPITFPRLTTFSSVLSYAHGATSFLARSCTAVRTWTVTGHGAEEFIRFVPDGQFPLLKTYDGPHMNLKGVLRARPVRSVSLLDPVMGEAIQELSEALILSQGPVTRLRLDLTVRGEKRPLERAGRTDLVGEEEWCMLRLARQNQSIQYFELTTDFRQKDDIQGRMPGFVRGIAGLQKLEELTWWDTRGRLLGEGFPRACFESAPALRIVSVNKTMYRRDQFE